MPSPLAEPDLAVATNLLDLVAAAAGYGDRPYLVPVEPAGRAVSFADVLTYVGRVAGPLDLEGGLADILDQERQPGQPAGRVKHDNTRESATSA